MLIGWRRDWEIWMLGLEKNSHIWLFGFFNWVKSRDEFESIEDGNPSTSENNTAGSSKDPAIVSSAVDQHCLVALRCLVRLVEHVGSSIQITTPVEVFGVRRKCCVMIESLREFSSMQPTCIACLDAYMMYLYTIMDAWKTLSLYKFLDAGSVSFSRYKESRAQLLNARLLGAEYDQLLLFPYNSGNHWSLVAVNHTKGLAFWIDPLKNRIEKDMSEVLEIVPRNQGS